ncbi:cell division protein FtsB [Pararobbsia silviterrae]|uniref:Cell division protein FtsB n=1 Tax=Pararobbsia silviterrae TaxID=1792498 RepID=A0A494X8A7_9BURK|nr:cell division protein FtsB [Pararobbsia silviterrae]RKP46690.1 cell division protein FtsB [Pararobbsia silviterrae]
MRLVTVVLIALLAMIQYPLWYGRGGWLRVHELETQLADQLKKNADLKQRNDRLAGEVQDLQTGTTALEERARYELGMIRDNEVFVQFVSPNEPIVLTPNAVAGPETSTRGVVAAAPVRVVPEPPSRTLLNEKKKADKAAKAKDAKAAKTTMKTAASK